MKLQRSTVILVLVAAVLGGAVLISESQRSPDNPDAAAENQGDRLFEFAEADVQTLTVDTEDTTLRFERDQAGDWQMLEPEQAQAEPAAIAFLLNLLRTESAEQTITITPDEQADFGFDTPVATVEFTLEDGTAHTMVLGGEDFSGGAIYALVDPETVPLPAEAEAVTVQVVPVDFINAVNRSVSEWQIATEPPASAASTPTLSEEPTDEPDKAGEAVPESSPSESTSQESPTDNAAEPEDETAENGEQ
ncbi:MAG: DUF4340 domain-containing protein [Leptolyngbya sp. SIO4C5]|nr:DUF4340 domain-containing protein [Leptolyngbya sp. SIO4C5]